MKGWRGTGTHGTTVTSFSGTRALLLLLLEGIGIAATTRRGGAGTETSVRIAIGEFFSAVVAQITLPRFRLDLAFPAAAACSC